MKVVLFCGGLGLRIRDSEHVPKPMVMLGQWSYALYLVHAAIIYALIEWIGVRPFGDVNVLWFVLVFGQRRSVAST